MSILDKLFGETKTIEQDAIKMLQSEAVKIATAAKAAEATLQRDYDEFVNSPKLNVSRPGDTPPRQFVGKTLDQLQSVLESYISERDLLVKDIAKLTEEQTQLTASITALQSSIDQLKSAPAANNGWTESTLDAANVQAVSNAQ